MHKKHYYILIIITSILLISYLHYSTLPQIHDLHNVFTELYYVPLFLGALLFGLKGAFLTFIFVLVLYIPYILMNWIDTFSFMANKLLHALFSGSFAFIAGFLVDREKKLQKQSEKDRYLAGLGRVATTIVHDLKNPLITISGFSRRIHDGKGNIGTASQAIIESAQKMQMIVHDVLDFAKPIRMSFEENDIRDIVNKAGESCKTKAEMEEVTLTIELPAKPSNITVSSFHMERALVNLINNAIDASERGHIVLISLLDGQELIKIRIKDYGAGMDEETLENIFIPFYTKKNSGTGLGMVITKKIIEGHAGKMSINSQPGEGTEVVILLPNKIAVKNIEYP